MRDMDLVVKILRTTRTHLCENCIYEPYLEDHDRSDLHFHETMCFLAEHGLVEIMGDWKTGYGAIGFTRVTWRGQDLLDNLDYVGNWEELMDLANHCSFDVFEKILKAKVLQSALKAIFFDPALFCTMGFGELDRYCTKGEKHKTP